MAAVLSCLLGACASLSPNLEVGTPPTPQEAVQRLDARRSSVRSFIMQGQISLIYPQGELYGDHLIQGVYPDHLRADVVDPFGRPVMSLATDGRKLIVLSFTDNIVYQGPATRENLGRFLGIAMSPSEIYALITGNPPVLAHTNATVTPTESADIMQLKLVHTSGSVGQGLNFQVGDYAVRGSWLRQIGGSATMSAVYENFKTFDLGRFPKRVELADSNGRTLTLENDDLSINPKVPGSVFEIKAPPSMKIKPLR